MSKPHKEDEENPLTFWQVLVSSFAAAFGVQAYKNRKRDFTQGKAVHFIIVGIFLVVCFVGGMVLLVNFIVAQAN